MKKMLTVAVLFIATFLMASAQSFDFEDIDLRRGMPRGWMNPDRQASVDSVVRHGGKYSLRIDNANSFAVTRMPFLYDGRKLQITGYIRTDDMAGRAIIEASMNASPNVQQRPEDHIVTRTFALDRPTGGEWRAFSFEVPLCSQITSCDLSVMMNGAGRLWVDDIEMLIDGQPLPLAEKRTPAPISYKAQADQRFEGGSGFIADGPFTPRQIDNLMVLARVWGFLKYYHPAVARGEYNWDYELFAMLPRIIDLQPRQRNETLYEWACSLGEVAQGDVQGSSPVEWLGDRDMLGAQLSDKLLSIAASPREVFNYYLTTVYGIGLAQYKNEELYPDMDYSDTGVKLLSVFRLWNAISYFYPYRHLTDDWDQALEDAITDVSESASRVDYLLSLYALLSRLNDTHATIQDPHQTLASSYKSVAPFISSSFADGKFVVTQVFNKDTVENLRVGDAITAIGGQSVSEYLEGQKRRFPASNFSSYVRDVAGTIGYSTQEEPYITYTVERDGSTTEQNVKTYSMQEFYQMVMANSASFEMPVTHKIIDDSIAYINLTAIGPPELDSVFNVCITYPKMILDMRGYPQGNLMGYLSRLIPGCPMISLMIKPDITVPGRFDTHPGDYLGGGDIGRVPRRIVVLVDQNTQSMSEFFVMMLQNAPNVVTVGSQTAGADGNTARLFLPGNIMAVFTGVGVLYPDGGETQGVGLRIDETVIPTLQGIRGGRDEQLERAIEILVGAN